MFILSFWIPCSVPAGRTHIPFRVLTGDLSSCNHIVITCHYRGNPAGGPPSQGRRSPRATLPSCGANKQEPVGSWVSVSSQESGERARPRQRPPHSWAHTRAHTPARARRHTRAHAHRSPPRDYLVGGGPAWSGAHSRSPRGRRRPPRPAPPLEPAEPGALWAAKFRGASPQGRRVGSGLARLHGAPDGRDRWPGARAARTDPSARLPPRSTPRPARISAPSAPRAFSPQGWSAASRAPARSLLLPGFDLRRRHPPWPVALLRRPNCCRCCLCFCCCSGTQAAATRRPPGPPRLQPLMARLESRTPGGPRGTLPPLWALAPKTWSLSTCSGFMRNTVGGARSREGATRFEASGPG